MNSATSKDEFGSLEAHQNHHLPGNFSHEATPNDRQKPERNPNAALVRPQFERCQAICPTVLR